MLNFFNTDTVLLNNLKYWGAQIERIIPQIRAALDDPKSKDELVGHLTSIFNEERMLFDRCTKILRLNYQDNRGIKYELEVSFQREDSDDAPYCVGFSREAALICTHWKEDDIEYWKWSCCGSTSGDHNPKIEHAKAYEFLKKIE